MRFRKTVKSDCWVRYVCLSVRMDPTERISRNLMSEFFLIVNEDQVCLKSDKNNGYFISGPMYSYDCISRNCS